MTRPEKLTEAHALLEKAASLLADVGYTGEAEWARDVANGVDVLMSNDPAIAVAA